jgi:hypothetical protein
MSFSCGELLPESRLLLAGKLVPKLASFNCPFFRSRRDIITCAARDSAIHGVRVSLYSIVQKEEDPGLVRGMTTRGRGVETEAGPE